MFTATMGAGPLDVNVSAAGVMAVEKVIATAVDSVQTLKSTTTDPCASPSKSAKAAYIWYSKTERGNDCAPR